MYANIPVIPPKAMVSGYGSIGMLVHAMASMPAKNAGALVAVNAISDAVPLIHGPMGCAALRKMNSFGVHTLFPDTPCTNMGEIDVVYGGQKRLERGIIETYERYRPALIVVIPTCPSDMIGDDLEAAVTRAKKEVDCAGVYSTGELIKGRPIGYHDVLCSLFDQLLPDGTKTGGLKGSVNIITFPVHSAGDKVHEMVEVLDDIGIPVNKIFFRNTCLKDIYDLPQASLNITDIPLPWLHRMKERFGVPCYATSSLDHPTEGEINPQGIDNSARIFLEIAYHLGKLKRAKEVVKRRKKKAADALAEEVKSLKGRKVAVVGGFFFGMGLMVVRDMGMEAGLLIYKTSGFESHGMSKNALRQIFEMDREKAEKYGFTPTVLVNPSFEEEINAVKDYGAELVIAPGTDIFRYHAEGIKAFDSTQFYLDSLSIGFECPAELARMLKRELEKPAQRTPLLSMLDYDRNESHLHPSWIKMEKVWRAVTEGGDGGCLYG
jgi:nitrogenase molybdenum-iron protein alpha/beta subunit